MICILLIIIYAFYIMYNAINISIITQTYLQLQKHFNIYCTPVDKLPRVEGKL